MPPRVHDQELTRACFGDPAKVLERREEQTCQGCALEGIKLNGHAVKVCRLGRPHGKRCSQYMARDE